MGYQFWLSYLAIISFMVYSGLCVGYYSGIAKECREFWFDIVLSGTFVKRKGYVCQKFDGSWEIVYNPK